MWHNFEAGLPQETVCTTVYREGDTGTFLGDTQCNGIPVEVISCPLGPMNKIKIKSLQGKPPILIFQHKKSHELERGVNFHFFPIFSASVLLLGPGVWCWLHHQPWGGAVPWEEGQYFHHFSRKFKIDAKNLHFCVKIVFFGGILYSGKYCHRKKLQI